MDEVLIESLVKDFEHDGKITPALADLTMNVRSQEVVCLLGPSGCGKSTLLNIVAGFLTADIGTVRVGGEQVKGPGRDRIMVFQAPVLLPWKTVGENISFALESGSTFGGTDDRKRIVEEILVSVGLDGFAGHYPYQLSGGMKQRAQIARALVMKGRVLLLDEPFGALDALTRIQMQRMLQDIVIQYRPTVLFVTHDVDEALFLSDYVYVLTSRPGRIMERIHVPWPRPRDTSIFEDRLFGKLATKIYRLLGL